MKSIYFIIGILLSLTSCYKEIMVSGSDQEIFNLSVAPELQEFIYSSKDTSYVLEDPGLALSLNSQPVYLKKISIRGRTALDYRRKSYSVKLEFPIYIKSRDGNETMVLSSFKLISLAMDYTYINNRIAFDLLEDAGIMPLFYKFVEFRLNGESQGVYLLLEDPETYVQERGSEYILRRDYHHQIRNAEYRPHVPAIPVEEYETRFREIYDQLPFYSGKELFEFLNSRIDLDRYFRKIGIDYFLMNGDYTDEVWLYSGIEQNEIRYNVIPWDYDDIFSPYPHEVGRAWAVGTVFGNRSYDTPEDITGEIGNKMIFSIEDDLDYAIAMDSFLYARYESILTSWVEEMEGYKIDALFNRVERELAPFYGDEKIIRQSQYDRRATSTELWQSNMQEKKALLKDRLEFMRRALKLEQ